MSSDVVTNTNQSRFFSSWIDYVLFCALVGLVPLIGFQGMTLWTKPHFQFFPIAWISFALLVIYRGVLSTPIAGLRTRIGWTFLIIALAGFVLAVFRFSPWQAQLSGILAIMGWLMIRMPNVPYYTLLAWITILLTTLPLPFNLDQSLVQRLQILATSSSSSLLDILSIPHLVKGNNLQIEKGELFVDEACSGVDSLYALVSATILLLVFQQKSLLQSLLLLLTVPIWAWAGNVLRITLIAYVFQQWDIDLLRGWQHTLLGLVIFSIVLIGVLSTMSLISQLFRANMKSDEWPHKFFKWISRWPKENTPVILTEPIYEPGRLLPTAHSSIWIALGVLSIVAFTGAGPWKKRDFGSAIDRGVVESSFNQTSIPAEFGGIQIIGFDTDHRDQNHYMGEFSVIWNGVDNNAPLLVSLDFPFVAHHPLEDCYVLTGSTIITEKDVVETFGSTVDYFREAELVDAFDQPSYVVYTLFEADGQSFAENSKLIDKLFPSPPAGFIYQLQIFIPNRGYPSDSDKSRYRQMLKQLKEHLLPTIQQLRP